MKLVSLLVSLPASLPAKSNRCFPLWLAVGLICFVGPFGGLLHAQDYSTSTGTPSFSLPYPVEMGIVDAATGNLHLEIPFGSFPQRGLGTVNVKLVYDSHIWKPQPSGSSLAWVAVADGFYDQGWRIVTTTPWLGSSPQVCTFDQEVHEPNGAGHFFHVNLGNGSIVYPNGFTYPESQCSVTSTVTSYATDSSGYKLVVATNSTTSAMTFQLYAPDGTREDLTFTNVYPSATLDSNGNYAPGAGYPGYYNTVDSLGRNIFLTVNSCCSCPVDPKLTILCYNVLNSQASASSMYSLTSWNAMPVGTQFMQSGVSECPLLPYPCELGNQLTKVTLPDGSNSSYSFTYDCDSSKSTICSSPAGLSAYYGEMTSMTLPTGEKITYGYTNYKDPQGSVSRWLTSKSSSSSTMTFTPYLLNGGGWGSYPCAPGVQMRGCQEVFVQKGDSSQDVATFAVGNGVWLTSLQKDDNTFGSPLLSTTTTSWDFSHPCTLTLCGGHGIQNGLRTKVLTTVSVPGGSITRQTTYAYDSPQTANVTAIKDWKYQSGTSPTFSSVPDRATYVAYATIGTNNNINRPLKRTICNNVGTDPDCPGGGTKVSQTKFVYDAYGANGSLALVSAAGTINHDDTNFGTAYTARGNATQISRWVSGTAYLTTAVSYDTTGQIVKVVDPAGNSTTLSYADNFYNDNGANPPQGASLSGSSNAYLTKITDSLGSTSLGYYVSGKLAFDTDYNGVTTYAHYLDSLDRPTETDYPIGWSRNTYTSPAQSDSYAAIGDTTASTTCVSCTHTQAVLDGLGRLSSGILVNNPAGAVTVSNTYDGMGRIKTSSHPNFGASDPNNVSETYLYDGLGRSLGVKHPDNQSTSNAYGANVTGLRGLAAQLGSSTSYGLGFPSISTDEEAQPRQEWIDGFGRVIEVDEPVSLRPKIIPWQATFYQYDVLGNLTSVVQGAQTRTYQYDGLSRLTKSITPEGGTVTQSYLTPSGTLCSGALSSNPCTRMDARNIVTTYSYDAANRITGKTYSVGPTAPVSYTYGTSAANFNIGRLTTLTNGSGSESYTYDKMGRVTQLSKTIGVNTYNIGYAYNAGGQLTQMTYPSGRVVQYSYDRVGHMCVVAAATAGCGNSTSPYLTIPSLSYDAAGRSLTSTYGNGVVVTAAYSPLRSQPLSLSYAKGATTLFGLTYYYQQDSTNCPNGNLGDNGRIQCVTDSVDSGRSVAYTYDYLARLNTANTKGSTTYPLWSLSETYDRYGNRSAQTVTAGSAFGSSLNINPANNQITGDTYDGSGNLTQINGSSGPFVYDAEGCLITARQSGANFSYTCDDHGLRVGKNWSAGSAVYIYSGSQQIAEYDSGLPLPTVEYVYGHNRLAHIANGAITYEHRDHLSPRLYTDANGNKLGENGHFPFGESWYSSGPTSTWVFGTYQRDGFDNALARQYSFSDGRFVSPDPLAGNVGDPQSLNRYAYSLNDPINRSDPSGLCGDDGIDDCGVIDPSLVWSGSSDPGFSDWFNWGPVSFDTSSFSAFSAFDPSSFSNGPNAADFSSGGLTGGASAGAAAPQNASISLSTVQNVLTVAGFIPIIGDFANLANAGIAIYQGHYGQAALFAFSAIPIAGVLGEAGQAAEIAAEVEQGVQAEKAFASAGEAASGLGDLTAQEASQIQNVVNKAGRPLEVVGSAARGARTAASDIDYLVPHSSLSYYEGLAEELPGIDPSHGIVPGTANPFMGPSIRFEPTNAVFP
jgi:RHS repeat-associated protein